MTVPLLLLPGILMPASLRYRPLIAALGSDVEAVPKEFELYAGQQPPAGYSIQMEIEGVIQAADATGFDRFHLYGHSGGGAIALAAACAHPARVLSLALDEPAFDFTEEERSSNPWADLDGIEGLPVAERMALFARSQLAEGVELPPSPPGPEPEWMASRTVGVLAFLAAARGYLIPDDRFEAFAGPVYHSLGRLSSPVFEARQDRLAKRFRNFRSELYEGLHHLHTSNQAEPERVARALRQLWSEV